MSEFRLVIEGISESDAAKLGDLVVELVAFANMVDEVGRDLSVSWERDD